MIERPVAFNDELERFLDYEVDPGELDRPRTAEAVSADRSR
jgi:hypothetical protein